MSLNLNSTDHAVEGQSLALCYQVFNAKFIISLVSFSFSLFFFIPFVFFCPVSGHIHFSELGFSLIGRYSLFLGTKMIYISIYVGRRRHKNEMGSSQLQLT